MRKSCRLFLISTVLSSLSAVSFGAPTGVNISGSFTGNVFDLGGNPIVADPTQASQPAGYYEFNLFVDITGLSSQEDMTYLAFKPVYSGGTSDSFADIGAGVYTSFNPTIDPPGSFGGAPAAAVFFLNQINAQGIALDVQTGSTSALYGDYAWNEQVGEPGGNNALGQPSRFGSLLIKWDGQTPGIVTFAPQVGNWLGILGNNDSNQGTIANKSFANNTPLTGHIDFGVVPEPASVALLGLGSLLIGVRRRTA